MKKNVVFILLTAFFAACTNENVTSEATTNNLALSPSKNQVVNKATNNKLATPSNIQVNAAGTVINFSGYSWTVTETPTTRQEPGPNYFSGGSAYVDASGFLHLKARKTGNYWTCGQVVLNQKLGHGTYQWKVEGPVNNLDKNVVLGLFNYNSASPGHDEIDIEFARWGYATNRILNYTVWPATGVTASNVTFNQDFTMAGNFSTHRFKWASKSINFKSLYGFQDGDTNLFASKSWSAPTSISTTAMPVIMNLWLFNAVPPVNGQDVEIIIHEFKYIPL